LYDDSGPGSFDVVEAALES